MYPDPFPHFTNGHDSLREYTTKPFTTCIAMYDEAMETMTQNYVRKNKLDEEEFQKKINQSKEKKRKERKHSKGNASSNFARNP